MSETAIKERPIVMSGDSVRAIIAGRKTQSRRVVTPQPPAEVDWRFARECAGWYEFEEAYRPYAALGKWSTRCPYGKPGQRLWVREAFSLHRGDDADWPERARAHCRRDPDDPATVAVFHRPHEGDPARDPLFFLGHRWHSPIHMPRRYSRLTLELNGVRVERLLDIGREDCEAELGLEPWTGDGPEPYERDLGALFCIAWDKLNARRGYPWSSSPWVWVLSFKRVEG